MGREAVEEAVMTNTPSAREVLDRVPSQLWIGGRWRDARSGATLKVEDPATGEVLGEVADASPEDAAAAVASNAAVQAEWAATPPRERGEVLRRAYEVMTERVEDLAVLMTLEMGKPLAESRAEVLYAAEFFRWFAEEAVRIEGRYAVAPNGKGRLLVMRQPVGPCLLITPWNFPLAMGTRKIGPGGRGGLHHDDQAGRADAAVDARAGAILDEVGLPAGVCNVVTDLAQRATMEPLITGGVVRKLSFTGSTEVGRRLMAQAADQVLRHLDGARRQRAVPRLRRRRPRRGGRGRGDRQDAQHRRGVHGREPVPRPRVGGGGVRASARRTARGHEGRQRSRRRGPGRTTDRRHPAGEGPRARDRRGPARRRDRHRW
jgi:hypothetical protein